MEGGEKLGVDRACDLNEYDHSKGVEYSDGSRIEGHVVGRNSCWLGGMATLMDAEMIGI